MAKHTCNKEAELAKMATQIDEMHCKLMGNGQPGMVDEFNQFKGAIKFLGVIAASGLLVGLISLGVQYVSARGFP